MVYLRFRLLKFPLNRWVICHSYITLLEGKVGDNHRKDGIQDYVGIGSRVGALGTWVTNAVQAGLVDEIQKKCW